MDLNSQKAREWLVAYKIDIWSTGMKCLHWKEGVQEFLAGFFEGVM